VVFALNQGMGTEQTVTMSVEVPAEDTTTADNAAITAAKTALETVATLTPVEGTDTSVLAMAQTILSTVQDASGVLVTVSDAAGNSKVGADGTIIYTGAAVTGNVVFALNQGMGTEQTVTMSVEVPAEVATQANLTSLTENLTAGFTPAFEGSTYTYSLAASTDEYGVELTATLEGATITYTYRGQSDKVVSSGTIESVPLEVGDNIITIQVAKEGMQTATYTLTITKTAPFTAGLGGTIGTYTDFVTIPNTFSGFYVSKNDRGFLGGGTCAVVEMAFPVPSDIGATSYTLQYYNDAESIWENFSNTPSTTANNLTLYISKTYKFRLLADNGDVSNTVDVTPAAPVSGESTYSTYFQNWGLDQSCDITGTMSPWVHRGLRASFIVTKLDGDNAGSIIENALNYQWYRVNPATFEMTPIAGATSLTYQTVSDDIGYWLMIRATGDGVNAGGFLQMLSMDGVLEPNKAYLSNITANGFVLNLDKATTTALTQTDLVLTDGNNNPVMISDVEQINAYTYSIEADIASTGYSFWLTNNSPFWRIAYQLMEFYNATLVSAKIKGVEVTSLGTQSDTIGSIEEGAVTIPSAQADDGTLATDFVATDLNAIVKAVKYAQGTTDFSGFDSADAYNNEAIADGDFFLIKVTAGDGVTVSYYKITVTVADIVSALTGADVTVSSGSVIFGYTFQDDIGPVSYPAALMAPYYLDTETSSVTLTDGINYVSANLSALGIASDGTVTYENISQIQAAFAGLNFVPSQIQIHLTGATEVNAGADAWVYDVTVDLDSAEITLLTPDATPPVGEADKLALNTDLGNAGTNVASVMISADGSDVINTKQWVTAETEATYQAAISSAQAVADNGEATQQQVDDAVSALAVATTTFNDAKQTGTETSLAIRWVTLKNVTDDVTGTLGGSLEANVGDVLEITEVAMNDGQPAGNRVDYFVAIQETAESTEAIGEILISPNSNTFTIPATFLQYDSVSGAISYPSIEGKYIHFGAELITDPDSGVAAEAGAIAAATSDSSTATVAASTTTPTQNIAFDINISDAKGIDGGNLTGTHTVTVISNNTAEGEAGRVYLGAVEFTNGVATVQASLANSGEQTMTVQIDGVTAAKIVTVTVQAPVTGLSGVITAIIGGDPIPGVDISFGGKEATTNASGEYTISDALSGSSFISLYADFYYHSATPFQVSAPGTYDAAMQNAGKITGNIVLEGTLPEGRTIMAKIVEYNNLDDAPVTNGAFTVRGVPVGSQTLSFYLTDGVDYQRVYISPNSGDHSLATGVTLNSFDSENSTISVPVTHPDGGTDDGIIDIGTVKLIYTDVP
jgi:predicted 3-demethylubiquinone-9 3-methyltransferase (glyoxalase superfamily)